MSQNITRLTRRSLLTKAAISVPALGIAGALAATPTAASANAFADGWWGSQTTLYLQRYYGLPIQDGIISGQDPSQQAINTCLTTGWDWSGASGSATIRALQAHMNQWGYGLEVDGILGPNTIWYFHKWFKQQPYTTFSRQTNVIWSLQFWLGMDQPPGFDP